MEDITQITVNSKLMDEMISFPRPINNTWWKIKTFFGCTPIYQARIFGEPKALGIGWVYTLKFHTKTIRIFGIKIKTINIYDNSNCNTLPVKN